MAGSNSKSKIKKNTTVARRTPMSSPNNRRPSMKVNFDGQILNGATYSAPALTAANSATSLYYLDCANTSRTGSTAAQQEQSVTSTFSPMTALYNEFIYKTVTMEWVPAISPGVADAGSQIYLAYIDNAEDIAGVTAASVSTVFGVAKYGRNTRFFNAWERFTCTVPLTNRRKLFDVNTNSSYLADVVDRSVQGAVVVGYSSISAAVLLGSWRFHYSVELRGLNNNLST